MVRLEVLGKPIITADDDGEDISVVKDRVRRRMKGSIAKTGGTTSRSSTFTVRTNFNWTNTQPRLVITSDTEDFDSTIIENFQAEGFQTTYLEYKGNHDQKLIVRNHIADPLDFGEKYAIVGER